MIIVIFSDPMKSPRCSHFKLDANVSSVGPWIPIVDYSCKHLSTSKHGYMHHQFDTRPYLQIQLSSSLQVLCVFRSHLIVFPWLFRKYDFHVFLAGKIITFGQGLSHENHQTHHYSQGFPMKITKLTIIPKVFPCKLPGFSHGIP